MPELHCIIKQRCFPVRMQDEIINEMERMTQDRRGVVLKFNLSPENGSMKIRPEL